MAKRVSKEVPIAERIIEFGKDDFLEKFANKALVLVAGTHILQYANEYHIVVYQCNESICYADIMPEPRLNSFVLNIAVSIGVDGKRFSVGSGKIEEELIGIDIIAYYEDPNGIKHEITQYSICRFLLKRPKLVVSEEGVLVFYTEDEILATTDCQQYVWVHWDDTIENCTSIENIIAYKEYCEVTLIEGKDVYDDLGNISEEAPRHAFALNFNLNVADHNMINPKITKMS